MEKCENYDNWCECEKRGCQGCFHNKYKKVKKYFVKLTKEQLNSLYGRMMNNEKI